MPELPNLISFECTSSSCSRDLLNVLKTSPRLRSLVMLWDDWVGFPAIRDLPSLQTLRLYLDSDVLHEPTILALPILGIPAFTSLTTLALCDCDEHSRTIRQCMRLSFPNLRVVRLEKLYAPVPLVYDFIHRHPTILEVKVQFSLMTDLRFEAVVKLIDGTGTWRFPDGFPAAEYAGVILDQPSLEELDLLHPVPPNWLGSYGAFENFAFCRTPRSPDALEWYSWKGSLRPRYDCTALAVYFEDPEDDEEHLDPNELFQRLEARGFLGKLQEVRFTTEIAPKRRLYPEELDFAEVLVSLGQATSSLFFTLMTMLKLIHSCSARYPYNAWVQSVNCLCTYRCPSH